MDNPTVSTKIHFQHLDIIRFLAAFMIVILHSYEAWCGWYGQVGALSGGTYTDLTAGGKLIDQLLRNLGLGVDIFFLISGFLITYILLEEKKKMGRVNILKFMIRRSLRIWPLYFLLIALTPFLITWVETAEPNYWANILFISNFTTIIDEQWTYPFAHFWSICIEEHFYLVWPFIIAFIPQKRLLVTFITIILGSIVFRAYTSMSEDFPWYTLFLHTLSRIDVIVIGAIGAYFFSGKKFEFRLSLFQRMVLLLVLIGSLMIEESVLWNTVFLATFKKYFYMAIVSVLLLDFNFNTNFRHVFKKGSFVHYLGKVSYGVYMYSNILLLIIIKKIMIYNDIKNMYVYFLLVFTLSILVPIISYELFEKHVLKLSKRFRVIETER
jgi:peptidoglycan/LPS O-acetylase OafA/YrhL